jgi:hypothetical protein
VVGKEVVDEGTSLVVLDHLAQGREEELLLDLGVLVQVLHDEPPPALQPLHVRHLHRHAN